ncbi:MAG: hypothetical protein ACR2QF_01535 [Geminicoccaceae bacterium]
MDTSLEGRQAGRVLSKFMHFLPSTRRIGVWLRTNQLVLTKNSRFRILIADLNGDDQSLTQTRHLEAALRDQPGIGVMPVGRGPDLIEEEVGEGTLEQCRSLLASHNGDSLIIGQVMLAGPRIRIRMIGRYDEVPGRHGPYQTDWTELPKRFGLDFEGQLLALAALSISPAARDEEDRGYLINLLRPAASKLTRLLEQQAVQADSEQQGGLWHILGLAASLLGEYTKSQRWLDVAVHAHKTALLMWQNESVVFDLAIAQNNLGHALRLLAQRAGSDDNQVTLLKESIQAFHQALHVYRVAQVHGFVSQTEANLAHADALMAEQSIAAE